MISSLGLKGVHVDHFKTGLLMREIHIYFGDIQEKHLKYGHWPFGMLNVWCSDTAIQTECKSSLFCG